MSDATKKKFIPIYCIDFDGVLHGYQSGWKGVSTIEDPPVPGAMLHLIEAARCFDVQIYSSRSSSHVGIVAMRRWLRRWMSHDADMTIFEAEDWIIENIKFPTSKPPAFIGLDDRVLTFVGAFPSMDALKGFKSWTAGGHNVKANGADAVYGFASWLTTRSEIIYTGATEDAGRMATLVDEYCTMQGLKVSAAYPNNLKPMVVK